MVLSHSLTPFDLAQLAPVAALIPPRIQEPTVPTPNPRQIFMAALGMPGPFTTQADQPFVIADRDGTPIMMALPTGSGPLARRDFANVVCAVLNDHCGFEPARALTAPVADAAE
jgi:hypothetical protein